MGAIKLMGDTLGLLLFYRNVFVTKIQANFDYK